MLEMAIRNDVLEKMLHDPSAIPMFLPLEFLKAITGDFSTEQELGRGGYGVVYKGILRSGKSIAVKKLFDLHVLEDNKFQKEVGYLMGIKHRNVVQFVGYCAESSWEAIKLQGSGNYIFAEIPKRLLCFEHVPNRSLDKYISDESSGLDWNRRYEIIRGICGGLHYLHEECHIVHLDLKPENILMDATMVPKIADFGLSRIFGEKQSQIITENCVGSRGYMAPEYLIQGIVSIKADIFSLGVIIIEILTGSRDYPLSVVPDSQDFIEKDSPKSTDTSFQHFKAKILEIWRSRLHISLGDTLLEQIRICAEIGIQCIQFNPGKRPVTQHIIDMLDEVNIIDGSTKPDMSTSAAVVQVLESEKIMQIFQDIGSRIEQVLDGISFDEPGISEKVREQIELIHTQLKRAKERSNSSDDDLFNGLMSVCNSSTNATGSDQDIHPGLSEKLQLVTISDLSQESLTLHEMSTGADPAAVVEKMSMLLKKIKDFVQTQVPASKTGISSKDNSTCPVVPDAFRCPISLGLMADPVMVSTGQTYERDSIARWFKAGNDTCPKTLQKLANKSLTPNYALHNLIVQWRGLNGLELEPPKRSAEVSSIEHNIVIELLQKLSSQNLLDQRGAAKMLRQLAKRNAENRACIGDSGGIPVLVGLLSTADVSTQEHIVTALLNLSIHEENKMRIVSSRAIPGLVHVLERGSMVARENAAATLFSLSLFKDKHEGRRIEGFDKNDDDGKSTSGIEEEENSEFLSFRRLFRVHPEDAKSGHIEGSHPSGISEGSPGSESFFKRLFRDRDRSLEDSELLTSKLLKEKYPDSTGNSEKQSGKPPLPNNVIAELRKGSYYASLELVQSLCDTSYGLVDIFPVEDRKIALRESLTEINSHIASSEKNGGVCFPMGKGICRVVHIPEDESVLLNSREKAPYLICVEVLKAETASHSKGSSDVNKLSKGEAPPGLPLKGVGQSTQNLDSKATDCGDPKPTDALAGELWTVKKERIRRSSVHGRLPGWDLRSVIVKSGDDCRQEHLAVQLVAHFYDIYQEAGLPLWLRPYEVIVTSAYAALIETIPDTASIHSIKSRFPNISSLRDYYVAKYEENSPNFKLAQRNFVESMAGYSILSYLLQIKDRHNGNLLIDEEGHIIHIDFGFMLSNSPGGVNFESAPFKLTRELLEVMDSDAEGTPSEFFDYFKVLCIQGFLTCRKHAERVILLVEMLQDSGFPCFKGGTRTILNLRKRFHLSLTEEQCVSLVLSLISSSMDAWRTRQYDYYQRVLNGIL